MSSDRLSAGPPVSPGLISSGYKTKSALSLEITNYLWNDYKDHLSRWTTAQFSDSGG